MLAERGGMGEKRNYLRKREKNRRDRKREHATTVELRKKEGVSRDLLLKLFY